MIISKITSKIKYTSKNLIDIEYLSLFLLEKCHQTQN